MAATPNFQDSHPYRRSGSVARCVERERAMVVIRLRVVAQGVLGSRVRGRRRQLSLVVAVVDGGRASWSLSQLQREAGCRAGYRNRWRQHRRRARLRQESRWSVVAELSAAVARSTTTPRRP
ncbi:hypothetical protein Dimus_007492 [Dionaea muscipula]